MRVTLPPWLRLDHPRSRGVYKRVRAMTDNLTGSSPLARGLRRRPPVHRRHVRIIPARAGFTGPDAARRVGSGDHPRSRGVYRNERVPAVGVTGSSPLARGLHLPDGDVFDPTGIIPARAGFTRIKRTGATTSADHPRSRGVYFRSLEVIWSPPGSSPLARGLPPDPCHGG